MLAGCFARVRPLSVNLLNYFIPGDALKLMAKYVHTWSDFRAAHAEFGDGEFDEVLIRLQLMF